MMPKLARSAVCALVKDLGGKVFELRDPEGRLLIAKCNVTPYETEMFRRATEAILPSHITNVSIPRLVSTDICHLPQSCRNVDSVIIAEKSSAPFDLQDLLSAQTSPEGLTPAMEGVRLRPEDMTALRETFRALNAQSVFHTDLKNESNILVRPGAAGALSFDLIDWGGPRDPSRRENDLAALDDVEKRLMQAGLIKDRETGQGARGVAASPGFTVSGIVADQARDDKPGMRC